MMGSQEDILLGKIESRVEGLIIAVIVLAGFLITFIVVEFGLFAFALMKKTKSGPFEAPDSVVVKGDKKKKKRSSKRGRKSSKSSKTSSKSSKSSKSSAGKPKSKRPKKPASGATGSSEVSSTLKPKKSVKPEKKKESGDKQRQSLPSAEKVKAMRTPVGAIDVTSGDAATETNIAHIKPQFPSKGNGNDIDTTTDQQIAAIPPQFEDPKTAKGSEDPPYVSNSAFAQIAKLVYEYLSAATCRPQVLPTHVTTTASTQQSTPNATLSSGSGQQTPQPTPFAQPVQIPQNAARAPFESSYLEVGLNGEIQNVVPPIKEVATNSLILNTAPSPANSTSANVADAKPSN